MADKEWANNRGDRERFNNEAIVKSIQREAKEHGATLAHGGRGGLPTKLARAVFRRDGYKCTVAGCGSRQDLDLDHLGGHPEEIREDPKADKTIKKAADLGHEDTMANIAVKCSKHHDQAHNRERAIQQGQRPQPWPKT